MNLLNLLTPYDQVTKRTETDKGKKLPNLISVQRNCQCKFQLK